MTSSGSGSWKSGKKQCRVKSEEDDAVTCSILISSPQRGCIHQRRRNSLQEEIRKVYDTLTDEEMIRLIQDRDDQQAQDYLLDKYKEFVKIKAARYFLVGAEKEDIIQEGMIGLFKAIRDYRPGKQASFKVFAEICVNRQIISAIKSATRQKHRPLNCYVSLDKPVFEEGKERTLLDMLGGGHGVDPENLLVDQEAFMDIEKNVTAMLSSLEWQALCKYLESKSYQQIAQELQRSTKSIDNALQRVKRKLEKYLASRDHELDLATLNKGLLIMAAKEHLRDGDEKNDRIETI